MKKVISVLVIITFLAGCVSSPIIPQKQIVSNFKKIKVVAIEPLPLEMPFDISNISASKGAILVVGAVLGGALGGAIAGAIAASMESETEKDAMKSAEVEKSLREGTEWIPTVILSDYATRQINGTGKSAERLLTLQPIPGVVNRRYADYEENWLRYTRAWYDAETSQLDYSEIKINDADLVAEVGLVVYSAGSKPYLIVKVAVKLVDPSTKKVIGRAKDYKITDIGNLEDMLANNGLKFKQEFTKIGEMLTKKCLAELNLLEADS